MVDFKTLLRGASEVLPNAESLEKLMQTRKIRLYLGIDPTGNLLTLGHAVVLRKLQQFAEAGHEVILLIGNGTVRVGDPTGRDKTRPVLTDEQIRENFVTWKKQASKILDFAKIKIMYNGDWLDALTYVDMIRLLSNVTIPQLMERDMFVERLKKGGTVFGHELLYPLLQGYDSVAMEVDLEIGGTDQTFNMLMGRTLLRNYKNREKWVLSMPIINGTDGRKMSKSYKNFIALTDPPEEIFGKLMSIKDEEMFVYADVFTDFDKKEFAKGMKNDPRNTKVLLAQSIVEWLYDEKKSQEALADFEAKFVKKELPENIPIVAIDKIEIEILKLIVHCKFANTNSEARRLVQQGAVFFDNEKIQDPRTVLKISSEKILKVGKRKFAKIVF